MCSSDLAELANHLNVNVGFEQRGPNQSHRVADVVRRNLAAATNAVEDFAKSIGKGFKHTGWSLAWETVGVAFSAALSAAIFSGVSRFL